MDWKVTAEVKPEWTVSGYKYTLCNVFDGIFFEAYEPDLTELKQ